jgi:hypothetical protein
MLAALFLLLAVASRLAGWPAYAPLAAGGVLAAALCIYAFLPRRSDTVSDSEATALDERAALGGELRSAHWFAARTEDSAWIQHHLSRAIDRIRATSWPDLYAPQRAPRAYAVTAVLGAAAIIVALLGPVTRAAYGPGLQGNREPGAAGRPLTVVELERELAVLLANLEEDVRAGGRTVTPEEVRKLLERVRDSQQKNAGRPEAKPLDDKLRERLDRASKAESLDADMRAALEDLKKALPAPDQENAKKTDGPREATGKTDAPGEGKAAQSDKNDGKADASAQMTSDAQPGSGQGIISMTNDPAGGAAKPGLGLGGGESGAPNSGVMVDIGAALRKESLETGAGEALGEPPTDLRHTTDRGTASVGLTRGAAAAAVRGRATTVPIVPEARRPAARAYFQRKK